jgi:hypothetical protein
MDAVEVLLLQSDLDDGVRRRLRAAFRPIRRTLRYQAPELVGLSWRRVRDAIRAVVDDPSLQARLLNVYVAERDPNAANQAAAAVA